jgi:hypothetical protein
MRLYNIPLNSGSDDYGNELAMEYLEDHDALSANALPTLVTRASLEAAATAAREALGTEASDLDESPAAAHGSLQPGAKAKVLKVRSGWWPI